MVSDDGAKLRRGHVAGDEIDGHFGHLAAEANREHARYSFQAEELHHIEDGAFPDRCYVKAYPHPSALFESQCRAKARLYCKAETGAVLVSQLYCPQGARAFVQ